MILFSTDILLFTTIMPLFTTKSLKYITKWDPCNKRWRWASPKSVSFTLVFGSNEYFDHGDNRGNHFDLRYEDRHWNGNKRNLVCKAALCHWRTLTQSYGRNS